MRIAATVTTSSFPVPSPVIAARNLSLTLGRPPARVEVLRGIDLIVEPGETVAVLGPSGSGKSSLMAVLAGLERPGGGEVRVVGLDFGRLDEDALAMARRGRIGIVLQAFHLLPTMTALENVAVPLELAGERDAFSRAEAELAAVGLAGRLGHYPAPALRGRAAARRHRPRAGRPAGLAVRRRADRQPRHHHPARRSWTCCSSGRARAGRPWSSSPMIPPWRAAAPAWWRWQTAGSSPIDRWRERARVSTAWRLAWRDLRRGGRGLLLLALCLFLGAAALAGIGSLSASILSALDSHGREMLGGDLELTVSQRRATVEELAAFAAAGKVSETVAMRAMADAGRGPVLVDLRGVDDRWPLVGRARLAPGALAPRPHDGQVAIAPALAERLNVRVGDRLRIGRASLRIVGLLAEEPDRLGAGFTLGPPVLVDLAGLDLTQAVQPGSLYESRYRLVLPPGRDAAAIGRQLVRRFPGAGWSARTSAQAAAGLRRGLDQLGQFLLLVGLAALTVAGVGVGSGVAAYLAAKTRTIATLKVLGARSTLIGAIFLAQLGATAVAGIVPGLAAGALVPAVVAWIAGDSLPVAPRLAIYPLPLATAALLAGTAALLFALPALARARRVPAATLLRDAVGGQGRPSGRLLAAMALLVAILVATAVLTASDRRLALGFVGATGALVLLLWLVGLALRWALARVPRPRAPLVRLALANLHRPGAQTERLVVALGLGFSLFVAMAAIDTSLSAELAGTVPAKAPRFFAIDLQPEDAGRFRSAVLKAAPGARIEAVPSLRGAISALKGVPVTRLRIPAGAWVLRGDRTLTWSATVPPRNEVVAGRWWPRDYRGPPLVSLEDRAAAALGLRIGDTITVSVLGVDVPARIAALRRIDWGGFGLNFAIVFSPGYIEEAPHALLASVYAPPDRDGSIARRVAAVLPSVTLIRVGDVIGQIGALLGQIAIAVRAAAAVTVVAGVAVLVGAVAATSRGRRYDAVILKLLGGRARQVLAVQAIEYALLSLLLAAVALLVGVGAGWFVVVHVLKLPWAPGWGSIALTLGASCTVTLGIGLLGSLPVLRARPALALRQF